MLGEIVPSGSPSRTSMRESAPIGLAVAKGVLRLNSRQPAPAMLARINLRRPIKSCFVKSCLDKSGFAKSGSPLHDAVGACRYFKFCPSACGRRFVQGPRSDALGRFEAVEGFQVVSRQQSGRQHPCRRFVLPLEFEGVGLGQITIEYEDRN